MDQADKRPVRHSSEAFNVHTGASEATAPDTARSAGYIPLTALVGTVTAVIVLVVAAVTFAITYTTSLETVEKIGERLATSLVTIARTKAEDVFNVPANTAIGLKLMALEPGMVLPVEDPTGFTVLNRTVEHIKAHVLSRASDYAVYAVIFDDGSSAAVRHHNESILIAFAANAKKAVNASCCADFWTVDFNYPSMRPTPYAVSSRATQGDNRQVFYQILKGLLQYSQTGYWAPPIYADSFYPPFFALPLAVPLRNSSGHFLGVVTLPLRWRFLCAPRALRQLGRRRPAEGQPSCYGQSVDHKVSPGFPCWVRRTGRPKRP
jgi:hypothetical protein